MIIDNLWYPDDDIPPEILARKKERRQKWMKRFLWYPLSFMAFGLNLYLNNLVFDHYEWLPEIFAPIMFLAFYLIPYGVYRLTIRIIKNIRSNS